MPPAARVPSPHLGRVLVLRTGTHCLDHAVQLCDLAHPCSFSAVHKAQVPYNLQFSTSVNAQAEVAAAKHSMGHKNHESQRCVRVKHLGRAESGRAQNVGGGVCVRETGEAATGTAGFLVSGW